jgi:hypothetical protein
MSVNRSPAASQLNMKRLSVSKIFSFIAGVVDAGDLHFRISPLIFVKIRILKTHLETQGPGGN